MATLPLIQPRVPLQGQNFPVAPAEAFGFSQAQATQYVAKNLQHLQDASDVTEITKLQNEGSASMAAGLHEAKTATITDQVTGEVRALKPEEYQAYANDKLKETYDYTLAQASNERVRRAVAAHLADNRIKAQTAIADQMFARKTDIATGNYLLAKDQMINDAVAAYKDPKLREAIFATYGKLNGQMEATNFFDHKKAAEEAIDFKNKVLERSMAVHAKQDPLGFNDALRQGQYPGASTTQVQQAMDISDREQHQREVRDAQVGKINSDAAERNFERQAENRELDIPTLRWAARIYGWPDDKVNGLINMQIGLKIANPYEKQLIENAMEPSYRNAVPNMNDIRDAENNLKRLAKNNQISTLTQEYRTAMGRLQNQYDRLRIQGEIQTTRGRQEARQDTGDAVANMRKLFQKFMPAQLDRPAVKSEMASRALEIEKMTPSEARQYVDKLEAKMQQDFDKNKSPNVHIQELRGIKKDK